jgi:hypothetical protein
MPLNFYCRKNLQEMRRRQEGPGGRVQKAGGHDSEAGLAAMQLKEIKEMLLLQQAEKTASASATSIGNDFGLTESDGACEDTPVKGFGAFSEAPHHRRPTLAMRQRAKNENKALS